MSALRPALVLAVAAAPLAAQTLPDTALGRWDVSPAACTAAATSLTAVDIGRATIGLYSGVAAVAEVERTGPVTFVAADYIQFEGVEDPGPPERTHFRLTQRDGPDRLTFRWQDVETVDLVRCDTEPFEPSAGPPSPLPVPTGLWVRAGDDCDAPSEDSWLVHEVDGLRGATSRSCTFGTTLSQGRRHAFFQTCAAADDGSTAVTLDVVTVSGPSRFSLLADGEDAARDYVWCGARPTP